MSRAFVTVGFAFECLLFGLVLKEYVFGAKFMKVFPDEACYCSIDCRYFFRTEEVPYGNKAVTLKLFVRVMPQLMRNVCNIK